MEMAIKEQQKTDELVMYLAEEHKVQSSTFLFI
jgi:hypothetical protein